MKMLLRFVRRYYVPILLLTCLMCIRGACVKIDGVDLPASANANEELKMTVHMTINCLADNTSHLVLGVLLPKSWHAAAGTKVSFSSSLGNGTMSLMSSNVVCPNSNGLLWPDALKHKYGVGTNLVDGVEWVVFQSDQTYTVNGGKNYTADIHIVTQAGPANRLFKLGFFLADSQDGFSDGLDGSSPSYAVLFSDCFSVTGGTGDLLDYCNPQIGSAQPLTALDNDIVTLVFDNGVLTTPLTGINDIYLCAKGFTDDGDSVTVCDPVAAAKLAAIGGEKYRIDLWPRGFFHIPEGKTLLRMEYYFMDATGAVKVGYGNTDKPFTYQFTCQ